MSFDFDVLIIGGGAVGLAIGRALTLRGRDVTVVDRNYSIGMETSSRNSEVIHAGIYYPEGSLKAQLCVRGRQLFYDYAGTHNIPFQRCGKLIVASGDNAEEGLAGIEKAATLAGVDNLEWLDRRGALAKEPEVACSLALFSPSTGIVDSHTLMLAYLTEVEAGGGRFVGQTHITHIQPLSRGGFQIAIKGEGDRMTARTVINSGGLWASHVSRSIDGFASDAIPNTRYARGVYFALESGKSPFKHLVYPLPDKASLGVHATLDLAGQVRFGPDVEWIDNPEDYFVDPTRGKEFKEAIAAYWPGICDKNLVAAYAGIRPKLCGPGDAPADFRIDGPNETGIDELYCLYGIESPGLTASLAIGEYVASLG